MREWPPDVSDETMNADDDMRNEYDFSTGGVLGKYYERYRQGTNVVLLDPDLLEESPDSESVNQTLRRVLRERRKRRGKSSAVSTSRKLMPGFRCLSSWGWPLAIRPRTPEPGAESKPVVRRTA
jgi:hypothetical protein